jgi:hypothetical protein
MNIRTLFLGKRLCNEERCLLCYLKSFASFYRSKFWSKKNKLSPRRVAKRCHTKYWFDCDKCGHVFDAPPHNVASITENWCSFCCKDRGHLRLCEDINCETCFENSLESILPPNSWSKKNIMSPRQIPKGSERIVWIICNRCPHEFDVMACKLKSEWCRYCCEHIKKLCEDEKCEWCWKNSFASCPKSKFWSIRNEESPRNVIKGCSSRKYWFVCDKCGNEFPMLPRDACIGKWCNKCNHKTEKKLFDFLVTTNPDAEHSKRIDWCVNEKGQCYEFDFFIPSLNLMVELDGDHHFVQVSHWKKNPKITRERDIMKMSKVLEHGISILRLYQPDIWSSSFNQ